MKKILLALVVLVVVGLPDLVAAEPESNGTLHTLWLPVIGGVERPETCSYTIQWDVPEPYIVKLDEPVTVAFSWKYDGGGHNNPSWWLRVKAPNSYVWLKTYQFRNLEHDGLRSASEVFVISAENEDHFLQPGEYQWNLFADCTPKGSTLPWTSISVNLAVIYE
jgi:hypothetical protein